jgi:hypothetical protein
VLLVRDGDTYVYLFPVANVKDFLFLSVLGVAQVDFACKLDLLAEVA